MEARAFRHRDYSREVVRRRESRAVRIAAALEATQASNRQLEAIDLRACPRDMKVAVREARRAGADQAKRLGAALLLEAALLAPPH